MAEARHADPVVRIDSGTLQGTRDADVLSFKGVPYAAAPIGALRWRAPQPAQRWKGIRAATKMGPLCPQKYQPGDSGVGPLPISEDCLTLNIFAPAKAKRAGVMFWIHGGGYVNGSGTAALYDGSALARQGVVVVTINYRLGRFGFLAHPALTASAGGEPVGNYALMDMIAALKWVRTNIGQFGGDPRHVTIFGESAGGAAVNALMVSPAARGLFARAIVESGLGRETVPSLADAEKRGVAFAQSAGLPNATAESLRKLTMEQILKAGDPDIFHGGTAMVDGRILKAAPLAGFGAGMEAPVPYMVGWNSLEFPAGSALMTAKPDPNSPFSATALERIKAAYPDFASFDRYLVSDTLFVEPGFKLAQLHAAHGYPAWTYQFSVLPKAVQVALKGAPHALERQYVFKTLATSQVPLDANDSAQADAMSAYWVAFASNGDPNGGGRPVWPRFTVQHGEIIDFTNDGPKPGVVPRRTALDAVSSVYPELK